MRSSGLRIRYIASFLLLLLPIILFSIITYTSAMSRNRQYVNTSSLDGFTYAANNITTVTSQLDYTSRTAFNIENELVLTNAGDVTVLSDAKLCAALDTLESRITTNVTALFYIRGDRYIYTGDGKYVYEDFEDSAQDTFDLTMSSLFSSLLKTKDASLVPLYSSEDIQTLSGLAYINPFPVDTNTKAMLVFCFSNEVITEEIENYMGPIVGDLYVYDDNYRLLYEKSGDAPLLPYSTAIKERGVGVQRIATGSGALMFMRVSDSLSGLHFVSVTNESDFYSSLKSGQRLMLILIAALIIILLALIMWISFFNYKPIRELVNHITGGDRKRNENELELIRNAYDRTLGTAETLSSHIMEITPLVKPRLVNLLISGRVGSEEEFETLALSADLQFSRQYNLALYVLLPEGNGAPEDQLDSVSMLVGYFRPAQAVPAVAELPAENALCVILNFSCQKETLPQAGEGFARQLHALLYDNGIQNVRIGVGTAYENPLQLSESFAEACAAVQLAPLSPEQVFGYAPLSGRDEIGQTGVFNGIEPLSLSLLNEGINRGKESVALRALDDIMRDISSVTPSFTFFRFYCSELVTFLLKKALGMELKLDQKRLSSLVSFNSQAEFVERVSELLKFLCDVMNERIRQNDSALKDRIMGFIIENFKRFDLSIQAVADDLAVKKGQVAACLKEVTGQNFVQYVSYLRMNEFKRLLLETDGIIRDLVDEIGYGDVPNFLRKFKQVEGMTPSQYRKLYQEKES